MLDELGISDHKMIRLVHSWFPTLDTDMVQYTVTRDKAMGNVLFTSTLAETKQMLFTLLACEEQFIVC